MTPPLLDDLPTEILSDICDWVYWGHCGDLLEFALASKKCYSVAKRLLYRTIHFNPANLSALRKAIRDCESSLERDGAFHLVRCLYITSEPNLRVCPPSWRHPTFFRDYRDLNDFLELEPCMRFANSKARETIASEAWGLLIRLMAQLPALADLHYLVRAILPLRLLLSLQDKKKLCRIHHYSLSLESLEDPVPNPDLTALIRSPHLHSIRVPMVWGIRQFYPYPRCYEAEAFTAMVTDNRLAPNLKEACLIHGRLGLGTLFPPPPWLPNRLVVPALGLLSNEHLIPRSADVPYRPSLHTLIIESSLRGPGIELLLDSWRSSGVFPQLNHLSVGYQASKSSTNFLVDAGVSALTNLRFICSTEKDVLYYRTVKELIGGLHQLTELNLTKWDFDMLDIADCLGSRLKTLKLVSFCERDHAYDINNERGRPDHLLYNINLSANELSQIADRCPEITEFHMQFHRSRGDAAEVEMYRIIGRLPKLRHLTLGLSASPPRRTVLPDGSMDTAKEPHFEGFYGDYLPNRHPYRKGHYRDVLLNSAIDRKLALYIFHAISSGKSNNSVPLETLSVRVCDAIKFEDNPQLHGYLPSPDDEPLIRDFLTALGVGVAMNVTRDMRDDRRDLLQISQSGYFHDVLDPMDEQDETCSAIYRLLWPAHTEDEDYNENWRRYWESKPLSGYEDVWSTAPDILRSTRPTGLYFRAERDPLTRWSNWGPQNIKSVVRMMDDRRYTCVWPEKFDG
ncbi:hypothetical protein CONLIGDRAFT_474035 [Coniochaeta ligniaria NRRL 30616]|uniref:Uncharacterized protein n=1 Tax=Coniochaeta ligniaria NRRL 30616 TaxID=1408157 RepID=A0A1J7JB75_9PEZI|nr:hypothetical protein CONLIGDRAFT_474035 [Coniochaeta ligniaria NRRL 30616]